MEKKKIKLWVCNQDIPMSIDPGKEVDFRIAAKTANDIFERYTDTYTSTDEDTIKSFIVLSMTLRALNAEKELAELREKRKTLLERLYELFNGDD